MTVYWLPFANIVFGSVNVILMLIHGTVMRIGITCKKIPL